VLVYLTLYFIPILTNSKMYLHIVTVRNCTRSWNQKVCHDSSIGPMQSYTI